MNRLTMKLIVLIATLTPLFNSRAYAFQARLNQSIRLRPSVTSPSSGRTSFSMKPLLAASTSSTSQWTKKRAHNTSLARSAAILAALGWAGYAARSPLVSIPRQSAATIHLLSYATWFGSSAWTTFIAGITMYRNLPRKTFGTLQSRLFPKYFNLGAITLLIQLITLKSLPLAESANATKALSLAFCMTFFNLFYLEPSATNIMFKRYELEEEKGGKDSEKYKKLVGKFGKFHGISSLTNLIALMGGVAHAYFMASALV